MKVKIEQKREKQIDSRCCSFAYVSWIDPFIILWNDRAAKDSRLASRHCLALPAFILLSFHRVEIHNIRIHPPIPFLVCCSMLKVRHPAGWSGTMMMAFSLPFKFANDFYVLTYPNQQQSSYWIDVVMGGKEWGHAISAW